MASIGSLSSGTSANLYGASIKGITGLASGLDVDTMIEGMTTATRKKIEKQLEKRQVLEWQQDAYRSISSKLIDFNTKFLSFTADMSLYRASTFAKSIITAHGSNSSKVSVTGASAALDNLKIWEVKQLAKNASLTSQQNATSGELATGDLDLTKEISIDNLADTSLDFKYGGKTYSAFLDADKDYSTPEAAVKSINEALMAVEVSDKVKLGDKVEIQYDTATNQFSFVDKQAGKENMITLSGGSEKALKALGLEGVDLKADNNIGESGTLNGTAVTEADLVTKQNLKDIIGGKELFFSYNGVSKSIKLPETGDITTMEGLKDSIQNSLNKVFGNGAVTVNVGGAGGTQGTLSFTTNASSTFRVTGGDAGLLGSSGALKMTAGDGNRLNMDAGFEENKMTGAGSGDLYTGTWKDQDGNDKEELYLEINGTRIKGLTAKSSMREIIQAINDSDAGVTISYMETSDKFTIAAKEGGTAGKIEFGEKVTDESGKDTVNFASVLFGMADCDEHNTAVSKGQDAIMTVSYGDSADVVEVVRNSNSFKFEGSDFTLNGTFTAKLTDPSDPNSPPIAEELITFTSKPDTEKVTKQVKDMVEAYNQLVEEVNKQNSTKPNRQYKPLTDEQKAKMSESEIRSYEEKAKEGILFNDSDLRGLSDKLRFVFSGVVNGKTLKDMGITVSSSYSEHGKISFDETKFSAALERDPEAVQTLFTGTVDGNNQDGFMARMSDIYVQYGKTDGIKGSLINKAGSPASASSLLKNSIQTQLDAIDENTKSLTKKLQAEIDRYSSQFTQLEKLIAQMNSQSSSLASFMG